MFIHKVRIRGSEAVLNFVNLFADDDRIVLADFFSAELTIVKSAIVLVTVAMSSAEEASTATFESYLEKNKANK